MRKVIGAAVEGKTTGSLPRAERQGLIELAGELGVVAILAYRDGRELLLEKLR